MSPIPPLLPKKQLKAGGDESYTIGLLVAMSLFAVVFIPITIELFDKAFKTPAQMTPTAVAQLVLVTVLVPLAIGIAVRYALPEFAERMVKPISLVATVLLVSVIPILFVAWPAIASLIGNGTIAIIAAFTLVGLAAGHLFGGPNPKDRTVLALSTASRHPGVAIAIASTNFPEQKLALAAILLYLLVSAIVTIPYLNWRKRAGVNYSLPDGWTVGTGPSITANWNAAAGDKWTVPLGASVSKLLTIGTQPVSVAFAGYYNIEHPTFGPDWTLRFTFTLLFPTRR